MSQEIDEKIVAMTFQNGNFEKDVRQTMATLEELEKSLQLKGAGDAISEIAKEAKKISFKDAINSLENFKAKATDISNKVTSLFKGITKPLQSIGNYIKKLASLTRTWLDIDISRSLANLEKKVLKAFTVDPIRSGWEEYNLKIESTATILNAVRDDFDSVGKAEAYVEQNLERLNKYADQTIYSFSDMTSNIAKFTNNGIKMETATTAMMGIANAAALAGQGSAEASRAMYNISQSMSMGKLLLMDWKSIENANMATLDLKNTLIEAGIASGKLYKDKNGKVFVKDVKKNGKAIEVTDKNFRETLQHGWATDQVMLTAFDTLAANWNSKSEAIKHLKSLHYDDETAEKLYETAEAAKLAATKVRTLRKMWETLTEAIQSSWANIWGRIIGNKSEAEEFFTDLSDKFSGMISKFMDPLDEAFREWRGYRKNYSESGDFLGWTDVKKGEDGRESFVQGIYDIVDVFGLLLDAFRKARQDVFGKLDANGLMDLTHKFRDFAKGLKESLGSLDDPSSKIRMIVNILKVFFAVLKAGWKVAKVTFNGLKNLFFKLVGGAEKFSGVLDKVAKWFIDLADSNSVAEIAKKLIDGLKKAFEKVANWISGGGIGRLFIKGNDLLGDFLADLGFTDAGQWVKDAGRWVVDAFNNAVAWISQAWEDVKRIANDIWTGIGDVIQKFTDAISWLFSPKEKPVKKKNLLLENYVLDEEDYPYSDPPIVKFFKGIYEGLVGIWDWITTHITGPIADGISLGFQKLQEAVNWLFTPTKDAEGNEGEPPIVTALVAAKNGLETAFDWIKTNIIAPVGWLISAGAQALHDAVSWLFEDVEGDDGTKRPRIIQVLIDVYEGLKTAFNWIKDNILEPIITPVIEGAKKLKDLVAEFFGGEKKGDEKPPIVKILENIGSWLSSAWTEVTRIVNTISSAVGNVISDIFNAIGSLFGDGSSSESEKMVSVDDLPIPRVQGAPPVEMFMQMVDDSDSTKEVKKPRFVEILETVAKAIEDAWAWIVRAIDTIKEKVGPYITTAWDTVSALFKPSDEYEGQSPISHWITIAYEGIQSALPQIEKALGDIWESIKKVATNIWDALLNLFASDDSKDIVDQDKVDQVAELSQKGGFFDVVTGLFESVANLFDKAVNWNGFDVIGKILADIFNGIGGMFTAFYNTVGTNSKGDTKIGEVIGSILESLGEIMGHVLKFIGSLLKGDMLGQGEFIWSFFTKLLEMWPTILTVIALVIGSTKLGSSISGLGSMGDLAKTITSIAIMIAAMAFAVSMFGNMDENKLKKGGAAVGVLVLVMAALLLALNKDNVASSANAAKVTGLERVLNNLIKWGAIVAIIALLPPILHSLSALKDVDGINFVGIAVGLVILIGGLMLIAKTFEKVELVSAVYGILKIGLVIATVIAVVATLGYILNLGGDNGHEILDAIRTCFSTIGEIVWGLADVIIGIFDVNRRNPVDKTEKAIDYTDKLAEVMAKFSERGVNLNEAAANFSGVFDMLGKITKLNMDEKNVQGLWNFFRNWENQTDTFGLTDVGFTPGNSVASGLLGFIIAMTTAVGNVLDQLEELEITDADLEYIGKYLDLVASMINIIRTLSLLVGDLGSANYNPDIWKEGDGSFIWLMQKIFDVFSSQNMDLGSFGFLQDNLEGLYEAFADIYNSSIVKAAAKIDMSPLTIAMANKIKEDSGIAAVLAEVFGLSAILGDAAIPIKNDNNGLFSGLTDLLSAFSGNGLLGGDTSLLSKFMGGDSLSSMFGGVEGVEKWFDLGDENTEGTIAYKMKHAMDGINFGDFNIGSTLLGEDDKLLGTGNILGAIDSLGLDMQTELDSIGADFKTSAKNMLQQLADGFNDPEARSVVIQAISDASRIVLEQLSSAFGSEYVITIRPVVDGNALNTVTNQLHSAAYGAGSGYGGGSGSAPTAITVRPPSVTVNYNNTALVGVVSRISSKMDDLELAIRTLKLTLNTRRVASYTDEYLGNNAKDQLRTNQLNWG